MDCRESKSISLQEVTCPPPQPSQHNRERTIVLSSTPIEEQDSTEHCSSHRCPVATHPRIPETNTSRQTQPDRWKHDTGNAWKHDTGNTADVVFGPRLTSTAPALDDLTGVKTEVTPKVKLDEETMPRSAHTPGSACTGSGVRVQSGSSKSSPSSFYHRARERRARRVRFYRNGDRFFKGMVYAVSTERFRSFESLLTSLTSSSICDNRTMPHGVRHIFTLDGARRIHGLQELEDGEAYVCASNDIFRTLDYAKNEECDWKMTSPRGMTSPRASVTPGSGGRDHHRSHSSQSQHDTPPKRERDGHVTMSVSPSRSATYPHSRDQQRHVASMVTPRLITVLKQGKRPRRAVRLLLNRKTAQNFEQVMSDIQQAVKMDCGNVRKLFGLSGRPVLTLGDFFTDDTVFIACGKEKMSVEQLDLDHMEIRQVNAYRPFSATMRDRVTLRRARNDRLRGQGTGEHGDTARNVGMSKSEGSDMCGDSVSTTTTIRPHSCETVLQQQQQPQNGHKDSYKNTETDDIAKPITLTNKYEVGPKIGTGNFAVVLECRDKKTKRKYALKIINKASCRGREKMIDNEVRILRYVNHPNIIRLIEDFSNKQRIFYIMELVKGGDLFDAIASSTKYTETDASGMLHNLASALDYLHAMKIVHRDVKPENLLIQQHEDGTKSLKLGDFGLATEVKGQLFTVCGTPTYVAPEVIAESGYGVKIDVWSAGVIAYILLCGFPPFSSPTDDQEELFDLIMTVCYDFPYPYWEDISQSAKNLIRRMLELDPDKRLSAAQVIQHKWVSGEATSAADLQKTVSSGLGTYFRRSPRSANRNAGIQIIATTALDKVSRYFQGRGSPLDRVRGTENE